MVASSWPATYKMVRAEEGGNDDDPQDHGGRTSRGIIQREYDSWRRMNHLATRDVWTAGEDEIEAIYKTQYWEPYCDRLPAGIDVEYFDMAVISGPHRGALTLQAALGVVQDGRIGIVTLETARNSEYAATITKISALRRSFYRRLGQRRFLQGWLNRVNICEGVALRVLHDSKPASAPAVPPLPLVA